MISVAFFNNKGGVGKTSLVYHLAWMFAELGVAVLAADLDPQANLTSMCLSDDRLEDLWTDDRHDTIAGALRPLLEGTGDVARAEVVSLAPSLWLVPGDLRLSLAEDELSSQWPACLDRKERAFRVISALWRILFDAAERHEARLVLIDVGPNLGALNRAALVASSHVAVPLAPDLYSLQGLRNLGPTLRRWREEWAERRLRNPQPNLPLPEGKMDAVGYVLLQHAVRLDRPVKAYERWMARIPDAFRKDMMASESNGVDIARDPYCLAALKHYRSLMPLAQEARKPVFLLRPGDGAIGGHALAVSDCYNDFRALARTLAARVGVALPSRSA
jgi:chromosome partitioning protein